ncbi:MAG TPA: FAD-binding protein [Candidatus Saccharimonadales bacterium]|nr:FAD-binding protein [Candidatus Saccharimonadales bacterium]
MKVSRDVNLSGYTSLKTGGPAKQLVELDTGDDLQEAIGQFAMEGPVWILGYGTNCLVSDKGLPGTVIINKSGGIEEIGPRKFKVDSGVNWDDFIQHAIANDAWGLEFTSGIPGGVGAAVAGNIAAYGHKVADCFVEATLLDTSNHSVGVRDASFFAFDYRTSSLQQPENHKLVVLDATFEFQDSPTGELGYASALAAAKDIGVEPDSLENRRKIILETRSRAGSLLKDAAEGPWTAGSFFKNPVVSEEKAQAIIDHEETNITREQLYVQNRIHGQNSMRVSAAHVLLAAGFRRGQAWENVGLHPDHILKIENLGNASSREMYDVVQVILRTVKDKLDIDLVPEVRFLGEF